MGWFDDQIKERRQNDDQVFADAFANIAGAVMGRKMYQALSDGSQMTRDAIDEILRYYHVASREIPDNIKDTNEQLEFLLRPYGIMRRNVTLERDWHKDAMGAMLGVRRSDGSVAALIPSGASGYSATDPETGKRVKISGKREGEFECEAVAFYKPFPLKALGMGDIVRFMARSLSGADILMTALAVLAVTLIAMITPKLHNLLFSTIIPLGNLRLLAAAAVFMVCVIVSRMLLTTVKSLLMARINTRLGVVVEAAAMMRLMSLPADFFKQYSAGELFSRTQYVKALCSMIVSAALATGLTSVFSLVYISQIVSYAPALAVPALTVISLTVVLSVASALLQMRVSRKRMKLAAKESGMSFALISGVQKIKLAGAEKRAFARWGNLYAKQAELAYNPPMFLKLNDVIATAISLGGTIAIYYTAVKSQVPVADYFAFNTAYGMVSGAFMGLAGIARTTAQVKPIMEMIEPILSAVPEVSEGKQVLSKLAGGIELSNVSFRYSDSMPPVFDNLSLKIRPGQYVAIVGKTGCGKTTLMKLLLGFERPQRGAIYYDGKDLNTIDLKSLRKKIGVVMQEGKLFQGDIFTNITISAPHLTLDDAWEAAELAGVAEDIRQMPMGMFTLISEGSGGISGGQRQRLMIARAIAPKPKLLMFDEATSALDNITQKRVSESMEQLKCTRLVIAHRLSTIKQCDRIIVIDGGRIIEDGTYEELIAQNGYFSRLVARQRLDLED